MLFDGNSVYSKKMWVGRITPSRRLPPPPPPPPPPLLSSQPPRDSYPSWKNIFAAIEKIAFIIVT